MQASVVGRRAARRSRTTLVPTECAK
jgi:hypothetical protein